MRGNSKFYLKDRCGERRTRRKFLLFPRCFESKQWRWLEYAEIVEEITEVDVGSTMEWGNYAYQWQEIGFSGEITIPTHLDNPQNND